PLGDEAAADACDGGGAAGEGVGHVLVGPCGPAVGLVGEEEYAGVLDRAGVGGTDAGEAVEPTALALREADGVLGRHGSEGQRRRPCYSRRPSTTTCLSTQPRIDHPQPLPASGTSGLFRRGASARPRSFPLSPFPPF